MWKRMRYHLRMRWCAVTHGRLSCAWISGWGRCHRNACLYEPCLCCQLCRNKLVMLASKLDGDPTGIRDLFLPLHLTSPSNIFIYSHVAIHLPPLKLHSSLHLLCLWLLVDSVGLLMSIFCLFCFPLGNQPDATWHWASFCLNPDSIEAVHSVLSLYSTSLLSTQHTHQQTAAFSCSVQILAALPRARITHLFSFKRGESCEFRTRNEWRCTLGL